MSGSVAGRRIRGRLSAGVAVPASARLEALAPFGPPVFIFVAQRNDAQTVLEDLYRRQLFLTRLADRLSRYQYHDLFRAFLLDRLREEFDAASLRAAR